MQFAIRMMTSLPRLCILLVPDCQTPAVAVFMPVEYLSPREGCCLNDGAEGDDGAAEDERAWATEFVSGVQRR